MTSMYGGTGMGASLSGLGKAGNKLPSGYKGGQLQQFTPEQMELFQQLFGHLGPESYTSRLAGGDQSLFEEMEAPAFRQFNQQIGGLASRFSGMGQGGRKSSGFQNTANQAASDFAQDLASRRQGLQRQAISDLQSMGTQLLGQRPYEQFLVEKQQKNSGWGGVAGAALGGLGGFLVGGPGGAMAGAQLGHKVGSAF